MALLGLFWIVLFFGTPFAIGAYIAKKHGPSIERNKRKRQIEAAMNRYEYDSELIDEVIDEWRWRQ
ncbi:MAG TPA: hypothetical protein VGZ32_08590 [Actinocrinis sp.]|jgi:RNase P protein component|uniref:hypothetical protein n=1 Tax=Actinocrinis sp. TaxID=1920516 RepID=UPI002DDD8863|nr:hypothetical protein [Actinocrinis sp.]HEV3170382.1 hypothetical protein [Actinocrinis sp.]